MEPRIDPRKAAPGALKAMLGLELYLQSSGLQDKLLNLVKFRVSQINGCAYCLDMHSKDLRAAGESEQRLYLLDAWRESPFYTDRERAALEWGRGGHADCRQPCADDVYERARVHFSEKELVNLTLAVVAINGWNRLSISLRAVPGKYQPQQYEQFVKQMAA
jgi:AhpD family alkylhydroperoxidase